MDWRKNIRVVVILVLLSLLISMCASCENEDLEIPEWEECSQNMGAHPCNFTLVDQNGDEFILYDHIGKIVILDFSAMWCAPCQLAALEVESLQEKYKDDIVYVTILIENSSRNTPSSGDVRKWASAFNIESAPVLSGNRNMLSPNPDFGWQLNAWPQFYIINKEMALEFNFTGFAPGRMEEVVSYMINGDSQAN